MIYKFYIILVKLDSITHIIFFKHLTQIPMHVSKMNIYYYNNTLNITTLMRSKVGFTFT